MTSSAPIGGFGPDAFSQVSGAGSDRSGSTTFGNSDSEPVVSNNDGSPSIGAGPHAVPTTASPITCVSYLPFATRAGHPPVPVTSNGTWVELSVVGSPCDSARRLADSVTSKGTAALPPCNRRSTASGRPVQVFVGAQVTETERIVRPSTAVVDSPPAHVRRANEPSAASA
jgi:hypothetical protein